MGIKTLEWAWSRNGLSAPAKFVLVALAFSANDDTGECWPASRSLAKNCGISQSTVWRHLKTLENHHLITRTPRYQNDPHRQTSNLYTLNFEGSLNDTPGVDRCDRGGSTGATPPIAPTRYHEHKEEQLIEQETTTNVWPEWFSLCYGVEGWKVSFETAEAWRIKNNIPPDLAERKAYGLREWWPRQPSKRRTEGDPYMTWQRFCRDDRDKEQNNGRNSTVTAVRRTIPEKPSPFAKYGSRSSSR